MFPVPGVVVGMDRGEQGWETRELRRCWLKDTKFQLDKTHKFKQSIVQHVDSNSEQCIAFLNIDESRI